SPVIAQFDLRRRFACSRSFDQILGHQPALDEPASIIAEEDRHPAAGMNLGRIREPFHEPVALDAMTKARQGWSRRWIRHPRKRLPVAAAAAESADQLPAPRRLLLLRGCLRHLLHYMLQARRRQRLAGE